MSRSIHDLTVGDIVELRLVDDLKRTTIVQYAGASGDFNPLHTDEVFATEVAGYPSVFAHGMLTMGMTGRVVTDTFGVDSIASFGGRFTAQVFPGDSLTAVLTVDAIDTDATTVSVVTRNQRDEVVFSGHARIRADQPT
ncbi:MaoC/PaaZ C-terminal domain-containing protein [Ilumatobacter nonamiensis]|uniref:MaoC/PaaZ C-terminal domain-containing protein n=1 Tax=Ilumatobacter nonamiensis TaxID=467093 RepID=UPI0003477C8D|nr:MaoC/PaaZ C-terminal domain-containing protein [Ilumatobacter nonamiensis]